MTTVSREHQKGKVISFLETLPFEEYLWPFLHVNLSWCPGPLSASIPRVLFMMSQLNHGFRPPDTWVPFNGVIVNPALIVSDSALKGDANLIFFFPYLCLLTWASAQDVLCVCC